MSENNNPASLLEVNLTRVKVQSNDGNKIN